MNIFYRILFIIIAVSVPAVSIIGAFNVVFRLPDIYVYEFNRNQISDEIDLGISDEELGQFFSEFMQGKEDEFDLFTEYRDREQAVFGTVERINMENARRLLNYSLYVIGGTAFLTILSYVILLVKKKKQELRIAFKGGIFAFAIMLIIFYTVFYIEQSRAFLYRQIFINPFGADDVLPLMLTEQFAQMSLIALSIVALVILVIFTSITWRLTKPRRMFW